MRRVRLRDRADGPRVEADLARMSIRPLPGAGRIAPDACRDGAAFNILYDFFCAVFGSEPRFAVQWTVAAVTLFIFKKKTGRYGRSVDASWRR